MNYEQTPKNSSETLVKDRIVLDNSDLLCGICQGVIIKNGDAPHTVNNGEQSYPGFCKHCNTWYHTRCQRKKGRCPKCTKKLIGSVPYCDHCKKETTHLSSMTVPDINCIKCGKRISLVATVFAGTSEALILFLLGVVSGAACIWAFNSHQAQSLLNATIVFCVAFSGPWIALCAGGAISNVLSQYSANLLEMIQLRIQIPISHPPDFRKRLFLLRLAIIYWNLLKSGLLGLVIVAGFGFAIWFIKYGKEAFRDVPNH